MKNFCFALLFIHSVTSWAQAALSPQAQTMLDSIRITNATIIACSYNPECMLKEYNNLLPNQTDDFIKNVITLNIENLNNNKGIFEEFNTTCHNAWFSEMNLAEIECLRQINAAITENKGVAKMREEKLSCMQNNMNPLIEKGNLFAAQKMVNLLGQYGKLDEQDAVQLKMQANMSKDSEQAFTSCQEIYDNLKPKFR